jgi:hypothetical protein
VQQDEAKEAEIPPASVADAESPVAVAGIAPAINTEVEPAVMPDSEFVPLTQKPSDEAVIAIAPPKQKKNEALPVARLIRRAKKAEIIKTEIPGLASYQAPEAIDEADHADSTLEAITIETPHDINPDVVVSEAYEPPVALVDDGAETAVADEPGDEQAQTFETFMSEQMYDMEESLTLETVQARAPDQPVEETLVQLAVCLAEGEESLAIKEVKEILHELEEVLQACRFEEDGEASYNVTPELVEKTLLLLSALGYEDPEEALLEFIESHGTDYWLQAMEYICQQMDSDDRWQLLNSSGIEDDVERLRQGAFYWLARNWSTIRIMTRN